jgi:hypothetical protein
VAPGKRFAMDEAQAFSSTRRLRKISDRFDLTLECIRRYYVGQSSPLGETLARYRDFFALFESFAGYADFFVLPDLATNDCSAVTVFPPFDDFKPPAVANDVDTYREYRRTNYRVRRGQKPSHRTARGRFAVTPAPTTAALRHGFTPHSAAGQSASTTRPAGSNWRKSGSPPNRLLEESDRTLHTRHPRCRRRQLISTPTAHRVTSRCLACIPLVQALAEPFNSRHSFDILLVKRQSGGAVVNLQGELVSIVQFGWGHGYGSTPKQLREFVKTAAI